MALPYGLDAEVIIGYIMVFVLSIIILVYLGYDLFWFISDGKEKKKKKGEKKKKEVELKKKEVELKNVSKVKKRIPKLEPIAETKV